jgi:hypothetical protein
LNKKIAFLSLFILIIVSLYLISFSGCSDAVAKVEPRNMTASPACEVQTLLNIG